MEENQGPFNPINGHGWDCNCGFCLLLWDTQFGTQVYLEWQNHWNESWKHWQTVNVTKS